MTSTDDLVGVVGERLRKGLAPFFDKPVTSMVLRDIEVATLELLHKMVQEGLVEIPTIGVSAFQDPDDPSKVILRFMQPGDEYALVVKKKT